MNYNEAKTLYVSRRGAYMRGRMCVNHPDRFAWQVCGFKDLAEYKDGIGLWLREDYLSIADKCKAYCVACTQTYKMSYRKRDSYKPAAKTPSQPAVYHAKKPSGKSFEGRFEKAVAKIVQYAALGLNVNEVAKLTDMSLDAVKLVLNPRK